MIVETVAVDYLYQVVVVRLVEGKKRQSFVGAPNHHQPNYLEPGVVFLLAFGWKVYLEVFFCPSLSFHLDL